MYGIVTPEGRLEIRDGVPTTDQVIEIVGGAPDLVRTQAGSDLVWWVDDDFIRKAHAGEYDRNVRGTVLAIMTGAPSQVFAGPMVITAAEYKPIEGYRILPLDDHEVAALLQVAQDIDHVVVGTGSLSEHLAGDPAARTLIARLADFARTAPWSTMQYQIMTVDEWLGTAATGTAPNSSAVPDA